MPTETLLKTSARFVVGDRVRIVRKGPNADLIGVIEKVDQRPIVPHYLVNFNKVLQQRFADFELGFAPKISQ